MIIVAVACIHSLVTPPRSLRGDYEAQMDTIKVDIIRLLLSRNVGTCFDPQRLQAVQRTLDTSMSSGPEVICL